MGPPSSLAQMALRMGSHSFSKYLLRTSYVRGTRIPEVEESDPTPALMELTASWVVSSLGEKKAAG